MKPFEKMLIVVLWILGQVLSAHSISTSLPNPGDTGSLQLSVQIGTRDYDSGSRIVDYDFALSLTTTAFPSRSDEANLPILAYDVNLIPIFLGKGDFLAAEATAVTRAPIFADNNVLVNAFRGNANALAEIRAGTTYVTPNQFREFLNVNEVVARRGFLEAEGVQLFGGSQAGQVAGSSAFQQTFGSVVGPLERGQTRVFSLQGPDRVGPGKMKFCEL